MVHTLHVVERGHERDASLSSEEERETNSFTHLISSSVGFLVKLDHQRTSQGGGEFRQEQREIVTKIVEWEREEWERSHGCDHCSCVVPSF